MARKDSMGVGMSLSIGFFLLYWVFLIGGEDLADRQFISPFWAMWAANILVGAAGVYLTYKTVKETSFIDWEHWGRVLRFWQKKISGQNMV
jgi:lipopolysaccharide export system permease protein